MLVQFSARNYKTFRETATLSMVASNYVKDHPEHVMEAKAGSSTRKLLRCAAVYGANASGKTKLLDAMTQMQRLVLKLHLREGSFSELAPFRLSSVTDQAPTAFEVILLLDGIQYRYGFEADRERVHSEWLYRKEFRVEVEVFSRQGQQLDTHPEWMKKGNSLKREGLIREDTLFLSVAAEFNDDISKSLLAWFLRFQGAGVWRDHDTVTRAMLYETAFRLQVVDLLNKADIAVTDLIAPDPQQHTAWRARYPRYDADGLPDGFADFDLDHEESLGTRKFLADLGPMLSTLRNGGVLHVDELDARLHPSLSEHLIRLFHTPETNPNGAQLIFNSHNTNLLEGDLFRRDQIWFTQKDRYGASVLFSLVEFKGVRKGEKIKDRYLEGRYGGVPYLIPFRPTHTITP